jgi:hypothetical protein
MTNSSNASPPSAASGIQNISPTRSPSSPYATPSPSATYHPLTTPHNQQSYQTATPVTATSAEFQGNGGSPHYHHHHVSAQAVPVPQSHQLYYPTSLSPTHQIYGNVGFSNFSYAPGWTHSTADYGLFQNTYHYQPEYISLINESGLVIQVSLYKRLLKFLIFLGPTLNRQTFHRRHQTSKRARNQTLKQSHNRRSIKVIEICRKIHHHVRLIMQLTTTI